MREIVAPFRNRQSLLQMGLCTLIFIGMAVPFKVMVLVEGFTEVRPVIPDGGRLYCLWLGCVAENVVPQHLLYHPLQQLRIPAGVGSARLYCAYQRRSQGGTGDAQQ